MPGLSGHAKTTWLHISFVLTRVLGENSKQKPNPAGIPYQTRDLSACSFYFKKHRDTTSSRRSQAPKRRRHGVPRTGHPSCVRTCPSLHRSLRSCRLPWCRSALCADWRALLHAGSQGADRPESVGRGTIPVSVRPSPTPCVVTMSRDAPDAALSDGASAQPTHIRHETATSIVISKITQLNRPPACLVEALCNEGYVYL